VPPQTTSIQIGIGDIAFLERRGARAQRGGGEFSRSVVLHRAFQTLRTLLEECDPRRTRGMPEVQHAFLTRILPQPWTLKRLEIEHLATRVEGVPGFRQAAADAGLDAAEVVAALASLTFAEKLALLDQAVQVQAPAATVAEEEGA
jgi:hypothetical protein